MKTNKIILPILPFNSLSSFVAKVKARLPRRNTEGFIEPSAKHRLFFHDTVLAVLQKDLNKAATLAASVNYELAQLNDTGVYRNYVVLIEKTSGFRGLGTYIFDLAFERNFVLEVPHPLFDTSTPEESRAIFQETNARAMFIAGTHRCANAAPSPCSGTTTACSAAGSEPFKVSDAGHYTKNFFQEAHRATLGLKVKPVAISFHGNEIASLPDIVLSNGTDKKAHHNSLVNRLRRKLNNLGVSTGSCNLPTDGNLSLCGTTNVQGRLSNGSKNPCNTDTNDRLGFVYSMSNNILMFVISRRS